jgi:hypothetical protein
MRISRRRLYSFLKITGSKFSGSKSKTSSEKLLFVPYAETNPKVEIMK